MHRIALIVSVFLCAIRVLTHAAEKPIATFSIVAFDPATEEFGVAVQSKFFSVGSVVPWAQAGVGAVATQSWANIQYGPDGLALLAKGKSPAEVVKALTTPDSRREFRQLGIVDAKGRAASFTGRWACSTGALARVASWGRRYRVRAPSGQAPWVASVRSARPCGRAWRPTRRTGLYHRALNAPVGALSSSSR